MDLGISGLASGFDWKSFVDQMTQIERAPQTRLRIDQSTLRQKNNAYGSLQTQLTNLKAKADALNDQALYNSRTVANTDATVGAASVNTGALAGSYTFAITQLATTASFQGAANISQPLTTNPSTLVLSAGAFTTPITAGYFTVNNTKITVATSDTLQSVLDQITSHVPGVTATYDSGTDKITLASTSDILLGSAGDTSNFLQAAQLSTKVDPADPNKNITSAFSLATLNLTAKLNDPQNHLVTPVAGATDQSFEINGVSITYNAANDSLSDVMNRINVSAAGVNVAYDKLSDRLVISNKDTGNLNIYVGNDTGNFLAATGLSTGTLQAGKDLLYTLNGGPALISHGNTITENSSGITGLTFKALKAGTAGSPVTTTVTVGTDTSKIKTAITDFIAEYNKTQALIDTQTASSTAADGKVTAGILANEGDVADIASNLRRQSFSYVSGLSGALTSLASLGISTSGYNNNLTLSDSTVLDAALANQLGAVKDLFTSANGVTTRLSSYLDTTAGENGTLATRQNNLATQASNIDTQIADMERVVQVDKDRLTKSFVAMETAQQNINQQLSYLQKNLGS